MQWRSSYVQWIQRTFIHATYWEVVALLIGNGSARSVHSVVGAGKLWSTSPSAPGRPSLVANPAKSDLRPRGEIADLFLIIEPRALHTVPP